VPALRDEAYALAKCSYLAVCHSPIGRGTAVFRDQASAAIMSMRLDEDPRIQRESREVPTFVAPRTGFPRLGLGPVACEHATTMIETPTWRDVRRKSMAPLGPGACLPVDQPRAVRHAMRNFSYFRNGGSWRSVF
jgi:hypothetical protein